MNRLTRVTATGALSTGPANLGSVLLTAGAGAAATLELRQDGASGGVIVALAALQGTSVSYTLAQCAFLQDLHATLTGAGASATIEH